MYLVVPISIMANPIPIFLIECPYNNFGFLSETKTTVETKRKYAEAIFDNQLQNSSMTRFLICDGCHIQSQSQGSIEFFMEDRYFFSFNNNIFENQ